MKIVASALLVMAFLPAASPARAQSQMSIFVPGFRMLWFPIADYGRTSIHRPSVGLRWHF
jgi:hypothetical protein